MIYFEIFLGNGCYGFVEIFLLLYVMKILNVIFVYVDYILEVCWILWDNLLFLKK